MSTVVEIATQILRVIDAIRDEGRLSKGLIQAKGDAMRIYDKAIAVRSLMLKEGSMAVTLIEKQAKGDASQLLCEKIVAEESLKAHWSRLQYLQAQLNGYQSIFKHLESTSK